MPKQLLTALAALSLVSALLAQAPATPAAAPAPASAAPLAFEVASIKPAGPIDPQKIMSGKMKIGMNIDQARVDIGSLSLSDLIRIAYKVKQHQIQGPDWLGVQRFDIVAKMPEGSNKDQVPEMLQSLLQDRFKLAIHRESKEQPVYALIVGKGGVKMKEVPDAPKDAPKPADGEDNGPPGTGGQVIGTGDGQVRMKPATDCKGMVMTNKQFGQMKWAMGEGGVMRMEVEKMNMTMLVEMITGMADRPVIDMTDLKGSYQVTLELSMEEMITMARAKAAQAGMNLPMMPPPKPAAGSAPGDAASSPTTSIFSAVQKLGLKLDPRKAPVETIFIDHVEKMPTEN